MIIVGACNENGALYKMDENGDNLELVYNIETRGASKNENNIFIASNNNKSIYKLDRNLNIINKTSDIKHDIHGCFVYQNLVYITDTYDDKLQIYDLDLNYKYFIDLTNGIKNNKTDKYNNFFHINDIIIENDFIYFTCFRYINKMHEKIHNRIKPKTGSLVKRSIEDNDFGTILIDNLTQPHSPFLFKNKILFCNSRKSSIVIKNDKKYECIKLNGFTRGLTVFDNKIYIGVSKSILRDTSKTFDKKVDNCSVEIYNLNTLKYIKSVNILSNEIYSINSTYM